MADTGYASGKASCSCGGDAAAMLATCGPCMIFFGTQPDHDTQLDQIGSFIYVEASPSLPPSPLQDGLFVISGVL
jgi:hypothetical protein